jgi:hypothetical protein
MLRVISERRSGGQGDTAGRFRSDLAAMPECGYYPLSAGRRLTASGWYPHSGNHAEAVANPDSPSVPLGLFFLATCRLQVLVGASSKYRTFSAAPPGRVRYSRRVPGVATPG